MAALKGGLAILVVAYRNSEAVENLAASLGGVGLADAQLVVHDNSPLPQLPQLRERIANLVGDYRYYHCLSNCGYGAGVNEAFRRASRDLVLILNPDAWLVKWSWGARSEMSTDMLPYDLVAPRILRPSGRTSHVYGRNRTWRDEVGRRLGLHQRPPQGTGYISGAAMLCRRDVFAALRGFDEDYFLYYEDIDLCRRAVERGYSVGVYDRLEVVHIGGESASKNRLASWVASYRSGAKFHQVEGRVPYWWRLLGILDGLVRMGRATLHRDWVRLSVARQFTLQVAREALSQDSR